MIATPDGLAGTLADDVQFARRTSPDGPSERNEHRRVRRPGSLVQSFATALWAPDALFEMARSGIGSVNWHIRAATTNAPVVFGADGMSAAAGVVRSRDLRPDDRSWRRASRRAARPAAGRPSLKAWAVRSAWTRSDPSHQQVGAARRAHRIARPAGVSGTSGSLIRLLAPSVRRDPRCDSLRADDRSGWALARTPRRGDDPRAQRRLPAGGRRVQRGAARPAVTKPIAVNRSPRTDRDRDR